MEKNGARLEALLPQAVAETLQTGEQTTLYFNADSAQDDGELITFQSDFVDRLFVLMQDIGNYAELSLRNLYLKQGAKHIAEQRFTVLNGLGRPLDAAERRLSYALFNFKYTATSDEKKEGLVSTIINEHSLANVSVMASQLGWIECAEASSLVELPLQDFGAVYATACRAAESAIRLELSDFHKSLTRRLQRDVGRLTEYYGSLATEIRRKIERRALQGKELADEESRIRATELELERKMTDQQEKYAIKIDVAPVNLMRLFMPAVVVNFEARFRKAVSEFPLVWNPLIKDFEAIPCQSCGFGLYGFNVCEDKLHVVCADCFKCPGCGRNTCRVCHPKKCVRCGAAYRSNER